MKVILNIILAILVFLAISSGVAKIMLVEHDVNLFSSYGFTNPILVGFGAIQLLGGILLVLKKTRAVGAILVSLTFLISGAILIMTQDWGFAIATIIALVMLGLVFINNMKERM